MIPVAPGTEDQTIAQLKRDANVITAARVARRYRLGGTFTPPTPLQLTQAYFTVTPGVTESNGLINEGQWDMHFIGAASAWGFSTETPAQPSLGSGVTIAIIDTGADVKHPSISGKIVGTKCFVTGANPSSGNDVSDLDGHGTNVAGIAAAMGTPGTGNDGYGFAGTALDANLYIYKVFPNPPAGGCTPTSSNSACGADTTDIAAALDDIITNHTARIASLSLGGSEDPIEENAVGEAIAANIIVVAAAGNSATGSLTYPAADPNVIAVGATSLNDTAPYTPSNPALYVSSFSQWGTKNSLDDPTSWGIVAPGGDPLGTNDNDVEHWIHNIYSSTAEPISPVRPHRRRSERTPTRCAGR